MKKETYLVTTFYRFIALSETEIDRVSATLTELAAKKNLKGLIILGNEGINATVAIQSSKAEELKKTLYDLKLFNPLVFKDSFSTFQPFRRFKIDLRDEIVTLGGEISPVEDTCSYLSPSRWHDMLTTKKDVVVIDIRNFYETRIGAFRRAIDPGIKKFSDFPDFVERSGIPKDKKILMYCTGGIRCEKASLEMKRQGFKDVSQLEGGILNYLREFPDGEFKGECFVFDHRVALDQNLKPSSIYKLCPHCGNPGGKNISCRMCGKEAVICRECSAEKARMTCSKNCAHHLATRPQAAVVMDVLD